MYFWRLLPYASVTYIAPCTSSFYPWMLTFHDCLQCIVHTRIISSNRGSQPPSNSLCATTSISVLQIWSFLKKMVFWTLVEPVKVIQNNKFVILCITSFTTLPLSFLFITLITTHTLSSHIYHLEALTCFTSTLMEACHVCVYVHQSSLLVKQYGTFFAFSHYRIWHPLNTHYLGKK